MRALITAMGSRGDVQPMLALARALRRNGHDVVVAASPDFAEWAGELGLPFVASGPNLQQWLQANWDEVNGGPRRFLRALKSIGDEMFPTWFDSTLRGAQGVDVIISASQFAAPSIAEKLGIPIIGVAYSPTMLRSAHHAPIFVPQQRLPRWVNALLWTVIDHTGITRRYINNERRKLGMAPIASMIAHLFEGFPILLACDALLAPTPPDWARFNVTTTGPWFYDDPLTLDRDVSAFLDAGPPPVYIGFGSMVSSNAAQVTRCLLEGVRGHRLLMSAGWAGIGRGEHPATVKVVRGPMPHAQLFPKVAAVIHHGGAGTTAAALRAGVPQVVVPHMADQFHNAHRLNVLGLAPAGIPVKKLTAARLYGAIEATLAIPAAARAQTAARLRNDDGLQRAVAFIENAVHK
jgi:vancomycin aglycone glucosyltransferase